MDRPSRCPGAGWGQSPRSWEHPSDRPVDRRPRPSASGYNDNRSRSPRKSGKPAQCCPVPRHRFLVHLAALRWPRHFLQSLLEPIGLHAEVRIHSLEPPVLLFHDLHLADQGRVYAAKLRQALIERRAAHAMQPAQPGQRHPAFALPQDRKNLGFGKSTRLHQNLLDHKARENSTFEDR